MVKGRSLVGILYTKCGLDKTMEGLLMEDVGQVRWGRCAEDWR